MLGAVRRETVRKSQRGGDNQFGCGGENVRQNGPWPGH